MSTVDCAASPRDGSAEGGALRCGDDTVTVYRRCAGCARCYPSNGECPDCIACGRCEQPTPREDITTTLDHDEMCSDCLDRYFWQCPECAGWNSNDDGHCDNDCRIPCDCEDCNTDTHSDLIHRYEYKPSAVFHGSGPLYFGIELEIHTPYGGVDDCAEIAVTHLDGLGYLKEDSSIGCGFEIVTHPMSYDWAHAGFPWPMLARLQAAGCSTSEQTGLHIHVSRAGFDSPCHTFRWMKFIYRNRDQVTLIARRSSQQWAAFTDDDRRAVKRYAKGAANYRHSAINTGNEDTFELRVFASSLRVEEVQAALAFAAASVEYTRGLDVPAIAGGGWRWAAFADWVEGRPQYAPLRAQMQALACAC